MSTLKKGSRGEEVKQLQTLLGIDSDGIFGTKTESAVKTYQSANGLTADGIVGPKTWAKLTGTTEPEKVSLECENLKQFTSPHGPLPYGPDKTWSTYASGGCGVTSFAIVQRAYGLAPENETATETIQRLGQYAWEHGYRIKGHGTTAGLFGTNGVKRTSTCNLARIKQALKDGQLVILCVKKGFGNGYTGSGHYIVAYGYDKTNLFVRDVGSSAAKRQTCPLTKVIIGLKGAYIITKV